MKNYENVFKMPLKIFFYIRYLKFRVINFGLYKIDDKILMIRYLKIIYFLDMKG